jgi:hypothetical protein
VTGRARLHALPAWPDHHGRQLGSHILALTRAGLGVGRIDCLVGDADRGLRGVLPEPVDLYDVRVEAHVAVARVPRVRAVPDVPAEVFAAEADLIAGRRPLGTRAEDRHG